MRKIDAEPIRCFIEDINSGSKMESRFFHKLGKWRDELLAGKEGVMDDILSEIPGADRQHLRQLIRNAAKEKEKDLPLKSSRALFKYLKELTSE